MRLILLLLAGLAIGACDRQKAADQQGEGVAVPGVPQKGVDRSHQGKPFPDVTFRELDHDGEITPESLRGTPVLINLWATWCAPCVKELPSLNALAKARSNQLFVMPVSQDMAPAASVNAFLDRLDVGEMGRYHDPKMALSGALGAEVLPTTILYDADGREVWRYVGDLDWTGPEARKLLDEIR